MVSFWSCWQGAPITILLSEKKDILQLIHDLYLGALTKSMKRIAILSGTMDEIGIWLANDIRDPTFIKSVGYYTRSTHFEWVHSGAQPIETRWGGQIIPILWNIKKEILHLIHDL